LGVRQRLNLFFACCQLHEWEATLQLIERRQSRFPSWILFFQIKPWIIIKQINWIRNFQYTREIPPKFEIFSDRLEITSYGGLFEGMTQADFFDGLSLPRNKELMRIYKDLGMVEQLGSGVLRILQAYSKECFKFFDNYLCMIFPRKTVEYHQKIDQEGLVERLVENQKRIVRLIANNLNVSKKEMSDAIGISTTAIDKNLTILKNKKIIKRVGSDKQRFRF
jgi:ATP-dependent DNA helicase RecG